MSDSPAFNLEDRYVKFAANTIQFSLLISRKDDSTAYLSNQMIRSASSSALNFGEFLGAQTDRDALNKASIVLKELKETRINLKILYQLNVDRPTIKTLLDETEQLVSITSSLIKKRKFA